MVADDGVIHTPITAHSRLTPLYGAFQTSVCRVLCGIYSCWTQSLTSGQRVSSGGRHSRGQGGFRACMNTSQLVRFIRFSTLRVQATQTHALLPLRLYLNTINTHRT